MIPPADAFFVFNNSVGIYTLHTYLIRFHPSGVLYDGWNLAGFSALQSLFPVFFGGNLHHLIKMPVKITQSAEACHNGNIKYRMICVAEQITGIHNSDGIQVIQRTCMHDSLKAPSKMGGAHMA